MIRFVPVVLTLISPDKRSISHSISGSGLTARPPRVRVATTLGSNHTVDTLRPRSGYTRHLSLTSSGQAEAATPPPARASDQ